MRENRILLRIMDEIRRVMIEKRLSSRELSERCQKLGYTKVTRSKIIRALYLSPGRQYFLNNTDDTIEGVLAALGYTGDDILKRVLATEERLKIRRSEDTLPKEIADFIKTKEAEPYLKLAYAQYKKVQAQRELERLQKELAVDEPTE